MQKLKSIIIALLCATTISAIATVGVGAVEDSEYVYGTMNIPYSDFYENEGVGYNVDAVSSATNSKWNKPSLTAGTYGVANEDGSGTILGVTYNVAVKKSDLADVSDKYNFVESEEKPTAYKVVTVSGEDVDFSAVVGSTTVLSGEAQLSTSTPWGDYLLDVTGAEVEGTIYGVLLTTTSGESFALRHLENIWRGEFAWSTGIKTTEPHGNTLSYENFVALSGQTIDTITYITENGYYTVDVNLYVPIKFVNEVAVKNTNINAGSTTLSTEGIPEDYNIVYNFDSLDASVSNNVITFKDAKPGQYTLTITDGNGKYADISTTFILSTNIMPVKYENGKLVAADDVNKEDFENYIENITSVTINDVSYSASGRGSVSIIKEDGTVDTTVSSQDTAIFEEGNIYNVVVKANGYDNDLKFTLSMVKEEPTKPVEPENPVNPENPTNPDSSVSTGDTANTVLPLAMLASAAVALGTVAKKKKSSN